MVNQQICIFGEVLFDHFPDGKRVLGGAPFNVAWHLHAFGLAPHFISRIGNDKQGNSIRDAMCKWGMDTIGLQRDNKICTGKVEVQFIDDEPHYNIVHPVAYDAIEMPAQDQSCGLLYHGSLALRDHISRNTAKQLTAKQFTLIFLDVNLRPPWYRIEQVHKMVRNANWIKLNVDELNELYPFAGTEATCMTTVLEDNQLDGLILTRGSSGASVLTACGSRFDIKPQVNVRLVDTVGAGDSFASVMILGLIKQWPLDVTLHRAQEFASALVGQRGATVDDMSFYHKFIDNWNND